MLNDMATMTAGKPAVETYLGKHFKSVAEQTLQLKGAQELTPRHHVIHAHVVFDVVNLYNQQVKVDSLDEHPTESCHQKVLQKSGYCNTSTL